MSQSNWSQLSEVKEIAAHHQTNKVLAGDKPFHDWYRFVLSYPPHLVRHYLKEFGVSEHDTVLDPFSGTGTTLVESQLLGYQSLGIEANPVVQFASTTKLDWSINPYRLQELALSIAQQVYQTLINQGIDDEDGSSEVAEASLLALSADEAKILLKNSISPLPLHKALVLREAIQQAEERYRNHLLLGFVTSLVREVSNLRFGPEVGVGKIKMNAQVLPPWLQAIEQMSRDLLLAKPASFGQSRVILGDARQAGQLLSPASISAVITSPPYPNEKDYSRTTRLESVVLGMAKDMSSLRGIKKTFVRSNTRSVYKEDDDHLWVQHLDSVNQLADRIEARRVELGKTSGFEKMYAKVTRQYFGGMARHLADLRPALKPGAMLGYVVGDQASYFRVMIRTGQLLAEIAADLGYQVEGIDLFRERFATRSRELLREEVVILKWPG